MPDTTPTTQEQTPMTEQTDPLPAPGAPHAYISVQRTHSEFADRPEWAHRAYVIPAHDADGIAYALHHGDTLLPIGPDGDTGTRWVTEEPAPVELEAAEDVTAPDDAVDKLAAIRALATQWANHPTPNQAPPGIRWQIDDGREILAILDGEAVCDGE